MTVIEVVQTLLADPRVKVLVAVLSLVAVAMPLIRYLHDRAEKKLYKRQIDALESIAASLEELRKR